MHSLVEYWEFAQRCLSISQTLELQRVHLFYNYIFGFKLTTFMFQITDFFKYQIFFSASLLWSDSTMLRVSFPLTCSKRLQFMALQNNGDCQMQLQKIQKLVVANCLIKKYHTRSPRRLDIISLIMSMCQILQNFDFILTLSQQTMHVVLLAMQIGHQQRKTC